MLFTKYRLQRIVARIVVGGDECARNSPAKSFNWTGRLLLVLMHSEQPRRDFDNDLLDAVAEIIHVVRPEPPSAQRVAVPERRAPEFCILGLVPRLAQAAPVCAEVAVIGRRVERNADRIAKSNDGQFDGRRSNGDCQQSLIFLERLAGDGVRLFPNFRRNFIHWTNCVQIIG